MQVAIVVLDVGHQSWPNRSALGRQQQRDRIALQTGLKVPHQPLGHVVYTSRIAYPRALAVVHLHGGDFGQRRLDAHVIGVLEIGRRSRLDTAVGRGHRGGRHRRDRFDRAKRGESAFGGDDALEQRFRARAFLGGDGRRLRRGWLLIACEPKRPTCPTCQLFLMLAGPHPRSLSLGGAASPRFPPAGHPNAGAALGTPAPRSGRGRSSPALPSAVFRRLKSIDVRSRLSSWMVSKLLNPMAWSCNANAAALPTSTIDSRSGFR